MTGSERFAPACALALVLAVMPITLPTRSPGSAGFPGFLRSLPSAAAVSPLPAPVILRLRLGEHHGPARPEPAITSTHTIAQGETLWDISRAAGVSVAALAAANRLSERATLHPGQMLWIPTPWTSAPATSVATRTGGPGTRTVVAGDTLWAIARASNVSVAAVAAANHLSADATLHPGQVLSLPPVGTRVRVAPAPSRLARTAGPVRQRRHRSASLPAVPPTRTPAAEQRLGLLWPSSGVVTSRFGWRIHPIFGTREFHTGVDIANRWGSPVLAARGGIVRFAGWMTGYGRLIVVDHGSGLQTTYSHLSTVLVGSGQHVNEGEMIGRIGSTGWSTGPHLLFEVRQNGVPQDPAGYLH